MNILVLTPYVSWPLDHGGRIRTFHLMRALAKSHQVRNVAVARAPREREDAEKLGEAAGIEVTPALVPTPDMRAPARRVAKWISVALGRSSLPRRWWNRGFAELVQSSVRARRPDLVVIDSVWMDVYRPLLDGIPFVASTHNMESDILLDIARRDPGFGGLVGERDARLLLREEASFFSAAAATVAVTPEDAARVRAVAPSAANVAVVENGVDTDRLRVLSQPPATGPLLFVGSFDYSANVDAASFLVNEILPVVRAKLGATEALLAGRSPPPQVQALDRLPGVTVAGRVEEVVPLYEKASAVVVPVRYGGGSRLKILEALAVARPVVTTRTGMRGLPVADGVHVLVADTPEAFASALARLRNEPGLVARLTQEGRRFVEAHHAWPELERKFAAVVDGVLTRAP
jgi:glycosyltransferase involved in cell wall biosynthesis